MQSRWTTHACMRSTMWTMIWHVNVGQEGNVGSYQQKTPRPGPYLSWYPHSSSYRLRHHRGRAPEIIHQSQGTWRTSSLPFSSPRGNSSPHWLCWPSVWKAKGREFGGLRGWVLFTGHGNVPPPILSVTRHLVVTVSGTLHVLHRVSSVPSKWAAAGWHWQKVSVLEGWTMWPCGRRGGTESSSRETEQGPS